MSTTTRKKTRPKPVKISKSSVQIPSGASLMQWRKDHGINRVLFAKLADCSERKLASYEKAPKIPENGLRRICETVKLIQALRELTGDDQALKEWLQKPNKAFSKRRPLELITTGQSDVIWQMVHQIRQGSFA